MKIFWKSEESRYITTSLLELLFFHLTFFHFRQNSLLGDWIRNSTNIYVFHNDIGRNGHIQDSLPLQIFEHCCFEWVFSHKFYNTIQFTHHFCFYHYQNMPKWKCKIATLFSPFWKGLWSLQKSGVSVSKPILFWQTSFEIYPNKHLYCWWFKSTIKTTSLFYE